MTNGVYHRYALDPTGVNPDNLVAGEAHVLSDRPQRFLIPKHGPFFSDSVILYDADTGQRLVKRSDLTEGHYVIPLISQEATLKFGLEVADGILITDPLIARNVLVTYQSVGGNFQNNIANVANIFEAFLNDNRAIDWITGVYGKPNYYPPGPHPTHLIDIFGFESLTFVMERIYQAILLGQVPAYEMIFDALKNHRATKEDVDAGRVNDKLVPLDVLQYATQRYNYNQISLLPMEGRLKNGKSLWFDVYCTNAPSVDQLYWKIHHLTTSPDDFVLASGSVQLIKGHGRFMIQSILDRRSEGPERFQVHLCRGGPDRYTVLESYDFTIGEHTSFYQDRILEACRIPCINSPRVKRTPKIVGVGRPILSSQQS